MLFGAAVAFGFFDDRSVGDVGEAVAVFGGEDQAAFAGERFDGRAVLVGWRDHLPGAVVSQRERRASRGWVVIVCSVPSLVPRLLIASPVVVGGRRFEFAESLG